MEQVLSGLHWETCLVYIDIVFSESAENNFHRLREVFTRLKAAGLKLKPAKCHLLHRSVKYLGHIVSADGVKTDPEKTQCIAEWSPPASQKELKQFLGLASYYRRFVKNFAQIAAPLHQLTQKDRKWNWSEECEHAFHHLKHLLTTAPVLAYPQFNHQFILDTDASQERIGAVLSQNIDGHERVIAYASRTLTKAERKYCTTRKEMLALVWGIRTYRPYLYGRRFQVRTDHNSLKWLHNFHEPEGQVARWLEVLSEFDFDVLHRPGKKHANADALSRLSSQEGQTNTHTCSLEMSTSWVPTWTPEEIQDLQRADTALNTMMSCMDQIRLHTIEVATQSM